MLDPSESLEGVGDRGGAPRGLRFATFALGFRAGWDDMSCFVLEINYGLYCFLIDYSSFWGASLFLDVYSVRDSRLSGKRNTKARQR